MKKLQIIRINEYAKQPTNNRQPANKVILDALGNKE
jgi:hypothetical protein